MTGFPEYHGRNRFPKKQAKGFCRGCRLPIDPELEPRAQTWHHACKKKFDPFHVKHAVHLRDEGKCVMCKCTTIQAREWNRARNTWPKNETHIERVDRLETLRGQREEYDHIIPHSEGGLFVLENMRLTCASCHSKRTSEWRRSKKKIMTDDSIRDEIVKYCDWTYDPTTGEVVFVHAGDIVGIPWPSLDAMQSAVSRLNLKETAMWAEHLERIVMFGANPHFTREFHLANACFKDRSQAFVKTIGVPNKPTPI